jgi:RNA polymerase sigma factor (sigma-70 family)
MKQPATLEIVRRCQENPNDREAFDLFYRAFYPYVRLYMRAFRPPVAVLSDEDLIQDVFLHLMEHFPEVEFKNESHFLGYLKAVCEHYVIDMVRKYEKQTYRELTEQLQLTSPGLSPEQAVANAERTESVLRLLGRLPDTCQSLLTSFLKEGLSLAEIARQHKIPEGTIYPRFSRCVAELRKRVLAHP